MKLTEQNGLRILTPDEGNMLYRKGDDNNFSKCFYLGIKDSPENFVEITEAEAEERTKELNGEGKEGEE